MAEENRKSLLADILKRERLEKSLKKDKTSEISKAKALIQEKESKSSSNNSSRDLSDRVNASKASSNYDQALEEMLLDIRFYFLKEGEYSSKFRTLFLNNKNNLDKYGITAKKFLEYAQESFDRYKKTHRMMPLDAMKPKSYKYVENSILELIRLMSEKFGK